MTTDLKSILNHEVLIEVIEKTVDEERYSPSEYLITRLQAIINRYKELDKEA